MTMHSSGASEWVNQTDNTETSVICINCMMQNFKASNPFSLHKTSLACKSLPFTCVLKARVSDASHMALWELFIMCSACMHAVQVTAGLELSMYSKS